MLTHTVDEKSGIVEIVIDGQVDPADYDAAITAIDAMIERHGTVKLLEVLKNIGWVDPSIWWKDTIWGLTRIRAFGRCAVVTDKGWVGDRKSTRLNSGTYAHLVCRPLIDKKTKIN